jgi:very-short-patch-repair endonuclease
MGPQPVSADEIIAELAARQHRIVARCQLMALGLSSKQIRRRIEQRRLFPLYRGVYAVGTPDPGPMGRLLAAVLACSEDAVLSHRSAAVHHGLLGREAGPVHVAVPRRRGTSPRPGIRLHCLPSLLPFDVRRRHGIPTTTVERTLVDIAATDPKDLKRAVEQAFVGKLIGRTRMAETLERASGQPGTSQLRRELAGLLPQLQFTRSELERKFLKMLKQANLPTPTVNRHQETHRVDFHWPDKALIVETDGRGIHDNPHAFEEDRARDLDLELAGVHVIRLSWRQVAEQPDRIAALLAARLGATPNRSRSMP